MQIVINIPEGLYVAIRKGDVIISDQRNGKSLMGKALMSIILNAIAKGTPLPKGHGDLKDSKLLDSRLNFVLNHTGGYKNTPMGTGIVIAMAENLDAKTIIEADRSEDE